MLNLQGAKEVQATVCLEQKESICGTMLMATRLNS